jgi:hypothetical protein
MNAKKGFIVPLVIVIIVVLAIGGGYYAYNNSHKSASTSETAVKTDVNTTVTATSSVSGNQQIASQTSNLKTYTNTQYGFQIQYPQEFKEETVVNGNNPHNLLTISYSQAAIKGTNLDGAKIDVVIDSTDESKCYSTDGVNPNIGTGIAKDKPAIMQLGGQTFHAAHEADAAMGHIHNTSYLSIYHNSQCYTLVLTASAYNQSFYDPSMPESKVKTYNPDTQLFPIYTQIASTFKFVSTAKPNQLTVDQIFKNINTYKNKTVTLEGYVWGMDIKNGSDMSVNFRSNSDIKAMTLSFYTSSNTITQTLIDAASKTNYEAWVKVKVIGELEPVHVYFNGASGDSLRLKATDLTIE